MLVVAASVLAVLSPLVAGRWPAGLLTHGWKRPWLVYVILVFQVVVLEVSMPRGLAASLHVLTYVAAVGFLWFNRRIAGLWVLAAGASLNGLVIALNGGTLPARASAVEAAGNTHSMEFANAGIVDDPVLPWLGDAFAWPAPMPLANTFSIGDILIVLGVGIAAWSGSRRLGSPASAPKVPDEPAARA